MILIVRDGPVRADLYKALRAACGLEPVAVFSIAGAKALLDSGVSIHGAIIYAKSESESKSPPQGHATQAAETELDLIDFILTRARRIPFLVVGVDVELRPNQFESLTFLGVFSSDDPKDICHAFEGHL